MSRQTIQKKRPDGSTYFVPAGRPADAVEQLGRIEKQAVDLINQTCDKYCIYGDKFQRSKIPFETLERYCRKCPLDKLGTLIYGKAREE